MNLMKRYFAWWAQGWLVILRYFAFCFVLILCCIPVWILGFLLPGVEDAPLLQSGRIQWRPAVYYLVCFLWMPVGFRAAAAYTQEFQRTQKLRNK